MIIGSNGKAAKVVRDLTREQCQVLVDMEPFLMNQGLAFDLWCIPCRRNWLNHQCVGHHEGQRFSVTCDCTIRQYTGDDITMPAPPTWHPRVKHVEAIVIDRALAQVAITRPQMRAIDDFESLLKSLQLQYALRCLQCRYDNQPDGVHGAHEGTAMSVVFECAHARRTYVGADAMATTH